MKKIAVIGAGIAGVIPAYYLAKKGHDVTIIDQERYPAMRCSYANGGQVSVSNSEVWNTWSNVQKGLKWMLQKDAPLLINPKPEWSKLKWAGKFLWHTLLKDHIPNTSRTIVMGIESRHLYEDIIKDEQIEFDRKTSGILHIYKKQKYFEQAEDIGAVYRANGCEWNILNVDGVYKTESTLKDNNDIVGGVWTASDWVGDIHKFCNALCDIMIRKYNVKLLLDIEVDNLKRISELYDQVVVAAGVGSARLARSIGDSINVYPVKGYSITIPAKDVVSYEAMPKASILDDEAKIVCSLLGTRLRVAGTAELCGENYDIRRDRIEPLLHWVQKNFPKVDCSEYSSWACLRPMTPNMMPIISKSKKRSNVFYHTGHGHLGWTLAPATARRLLSIMS